MKACLLTPYHGTARKIAEWSCSLAGTMGAATEAAGVSVKVVFVTAFVAAIAQLAVYRQLLQLEPVRESA